MAHIVGEAQLVKNRWGLFWGVAAVAAVVLILIGAVNFASKAGSGTSATASGVYWQGTAGETEEVAVRLPLNSWWDVDSNKPVIIRLANGRRFGRRVDGSIIEIGADGSVTSATTIGDTIPGSVIYLSALKGEKMAKVTITVVRKAREETKPTLPPPAVAPTPPARRATPLPPARPLSPKSGMV